MGVVTVTWFTLKCFGPYHISETAEARHFKFGRQTDGGICVTD